MFDFNATQYQPNRTLWGNSPSEPVQSFVIESPSVEENAVVDDNNAEEAPIVGPGPHNQPGWGLNSMSLENFFEQVNLNGDNELTADEVINAYNSTENKILKRILSCFTDGENVTDVFKMACGGRSAIEGYEQGNKGLTLNTDDVDFITRDGEISLEMLSLLEEVNTSLFFKDNINYREIVIRILDYSKNGEITEELKTLLLESIKSRYGDYIDVKTSLIYDDKGSLYNGGIINLKIENGVIVGLYI